MVQTKYSTSMLQFYSHLFPLIKYLKFKISLEACFFFKYELLLTLSVPEKLKNSIFEVPIITQSLKTNNLRTTSAKSMNQNAIRKLV